MALCLNPKVVFAFSRTLQSGRISDKSFYLFLLNLSGFCTTLRFVLPSFVLLAERIWSLPISRMLSAAPQNQGIV